MTIRYRFFIQIIILVTIFSVDMQFGRNAKAQIDQTAISMSAVESTVESELIVQVDLNTAEDTQYAAGAFAITYNPIALEPVDCQVQNSFLGVCNLNRPGEVLFNALNAQGVAGDLILVEVAFKVISPDSVNLNLQMTEPMVNPLGYSIEASVSQSQINDLNTALAQNTLLNSTTSNIQPSPAQAQESVDLSAATTKQATDPEEENTGQTQTEVEVPLTTNPIQVQESEVTPQVQVDERVTTNEEKHTPPALTSASPESVTPITNSNNPDPTSRAEPKPDLNLEQGQEDTNVQVLETQKDNESSIAEVAQLSKKPLGQASESNSEKIDGYGERTKTNGSFNTQILWIGFAVSIALLAACVIGIFLTINKNKN